MEELYSAVSAADDLVLYEQLKKLCKVILKLQKFTSDDNKLRKREEHSNSVHPVAEATTTVVLQTTNGSTPVATAATAQPPEINDPLAYSGQFLWAFPPPQPAQRMLYNNEQKEIVQIANSDRPGFVRGFRKNLGGRWRRLVKKKPPTDMCAIPPELKPQLKQMYVY